MSGRGWGLVLVGIACTWAACGGERTSGGTGGDNGAGVTPSGGTDGGNSGGTAGGTTGGGGGTPDAGVRRPPLPFGTPGPWPEGNARYGSAEGILESPVVGMTTDETQNLWVATPQALYLLRPGETRFHRYDAADGLHLQTNPVTYCDNNFGDPNALPRCPITGAAADPGITEIVGGGPDEVMVGYAGIDTGSGDYNDPNRHSGKLDRVRLHTDGTVEVARFDIVSNAHGAQWWHNRTVMRMAYDHFTHKHDLYVGFNHGVTMLRPDNYRPVNKGEWFDTVYQEYMADHLHARVCKGAPCQANPGGDESGQMMGEWRGLAIAPDGNLWTAGKWSAGEIGWTANLKDWFSRGGGAFLESFGDPYYPNGTPNENGFLNEPVFKVPAEGDPVYLVAVSVAPDGRVWFAATQRKPEDPVYGVAVWNGRAFTTYTPAQVGMEEAALRDLVALPDGRILIAGATTGLSLFDPATGTSVPLRAPKYLPDNRVHRLEVDTMVSPWAVHVSTDTGAVRLKTLP